MRRTPFFMIAFLILVSFAFNGNIAQSGEMSPGKSADSDQVILKGKPGKDNPPPDKPGNPDKPGKHGKGYSGSKGPDGDKGKSAKHEFGKGKDFPKIPGPTERVLKLDYRVHVSEMPSDAQSAYVWIPMPRTTPYQSLIDYKVNGNWDYQIVKDQFYGNKFIRVNLKSNQNRKSPNAQVMVKYNVRRLSSQPINTGNERHRYEEHEMKRYLQPDNLVPVQGRIYDRAWDIVGAESGFQVRARLIFDDIVASFKYDDSGFDLSHGDAVRTMESQSGSSADLNSVFIGEARAVAIPSRLVAGVSIPIGSKGEISLYHTWSEFHEPDLGWIPVDIGHAMTHEEYRDSYFGGLDANRLEFTIGRDIILPGSKAGPLNIAVKPYVELNGRRFDNYKHSISYQEIPGKGKLK